MDVKKLLKMNKTIQIIGKKYYIFKQFRKDAKDFSRYFCKSSDKNEISYSIMLLVHSLEKGMCFSEPRKFGDEKVLLLMNYLKGYLCTDFDRYEYKLGISVLYAWLDFYKKQGWEQDSIQSNVTVFLQERPRPLDVISGAKEYIPRKNDNLENFYFEFLSRHSVRDFQNRNIEFDDIKFALRCFVDTPTACNRQMCRIIYINKPELKNLLDNIIIGIPGFNKGVVQYFVITYDLAAFMYSGERQQGMFNAGLCTMNFINGLHAKGIGSCCLQWSNKDKEDEMVRNKLELRDSERIGVIIGAGYYLDKNIIPCSVRRNPEDIYRVV